MQVGRARAIAGKVSRRQGSADAHRVTQLVMDGRHLVLLVAMVTLASLSTSGDLAVTRWTIDS